MDLSLPIDHSSPVGQLARRHPALIETFERLDIDYATKGGRSLREAALAAGHDPDETLNVVCSEAGPPVPDGTMSDLLQAITTQHHRLSTDHLQEVMRKLDCDALPSPECRRLRRIVANLSRAMIDHVAREERHLFPPIEDLTEHPHRVRAGSLSRPLLSEVVQNDGAHEALVRIRHLVLRMRAQKSCDESLLDALESFDRDCHRHMHLETNILIPRVIELENSLKTVRRADLVPA